MRAEAEAAGTKASRLDVAATALERARPASPLSLFGQWL